MQNMMNPWKSRMMTLTAVVFAVAVITGQADGQSPEGQSIVEASLLQDRAEPAAEGESLPVPPEPAPPQDGIGPDQPAPGQPAADAPGCSCGPVCVYNPCIKYVGERRLKRFCCGCKCPTFETVTMTVEDPARCGCAVEVPICVPTCCKGEPCIDGRCGVFGRGVVWMKWCCGYKVRVLFAGNNECKGRNVIVTYYGK